MKDKFTSNIDFNLLRLVIILCSILLFVIYLIIKTIKVESTNKELRQNGIPIKAVVYDKKDVGSKGDTHVYYFFKVNGNTYKNMSYFDDFANINDSIIIYYLSDNPSINASAESIR